MTPSDPYFLRRLPERVKPDQLLLSARFIADRNATCCQILVPGYSFAAFTGSAKRAKGEPHLPDVGRGLALARALTAAGKAIEQRELQIVADATGG